MHPLAKCLGALSIALLLAACPSFATVNARPGQRAARPGVHFRPAVNLLSPSGELLSEFKLLADNPSEVGYFGWVVDIDGDTAVVSALGNRFAGHPDNIVNVYVRQETGWVLQQTLSAHDDDPTADDAFAYSLAVDGDTLVVGAIGDSDGAFVAGAAYVYARSGSSWSLQQKLVASDAVSFAAYGISVAVEGDAVVVGAHGDDDFGYMTGAAYVYRRQGAVWTEEQKLLASDPAPENAFGLDVAIDGRTIAVGAPNVSSGGSSYSGAVYTFVRDEAGWTQEAKLTARDAAENQVFGTGVSVSGDTMVVAAPGDKVGTHTYGAAYVYGRDGSGWTQQRKLIDTDVKRFEGFAWSVAVDGDTIAVGNICSNEAAGFGGAVHLYARNGNSGWSLTEKLTAGDAAYLDLLGGSVAVSGGTVIAGVPSKDGLTTESGAAYIFR
ncbi:MAG TPA: hypothetical protein VGX48_08025 [Pyrinomonadaceae bacterium]|jgi:hypothetical protein|nr:hypothetical protein [Pyrinomonadaceae bacterium]